MGSSAFDLRMQLAAQTPWVSLGLFLQHSQILFPPLPPGQRKSPGRSSLFSSPSEKQGASLDLPLFQLSATSGMTRKPRTRHTLADTNRTEGRRPVAAALEMRGQLTCSPSSSPGKQDPPRGQPSRGCLRRSRRPRDASKGPRGAQKSFGVGNRPLLASSRAMASGKEPLGDLVITQSQSLSSDTYLPKLLEGLQNLRSQNALCDVVLKAEGASFPAHKAILAAASSYCKVRFAGEAASQVTQLELAPPVTARGLQGVLSFVYSNQLELTLQTVEGVFRAAEALLVREVMCLTFRFLEGALGQHTCLPILKITQRLGPEELKQKARHCLSKHCSTILKDPAQLKKLDRTTLCEILDGGDTRGLSELQLFQAAVCWLDHNGTRQKDAAEVLRYIRFPCIPLLDLQQFVQEVPVMRAEPACRRYLQEAFDYHVQLHAQPVLQSERTRARNRDRMLIVLGGRSANNAVCEDVWAADQHCHLWKTIGKLSGPVYNHCVAVLHDFVFVLGGQESFDPTGQHPSNKVFRFDPYHNTWLQLASMLVRRTRFYAGVLNERLVAVGGGTLLGMLTDTVEEYHLAENQWRPVTPFPVPAADHAGTTHKGILYISGGFAKGQTLRTMYSYLSRLRCWIKNRPMAFARCDHGMAAVEDRIFCIGGRALTNAQEWVPVSKVECYCPVTDQWAQLQLHLSAIDLCHFSLTASQLQLYVTGGGSLRRRSKEDGVWVCDPGRRVWKKAGRLPQALADHACCFVHLPPWIASPQEPEGGEPSDDSGKQSPSAC